ncbi:unnamed protein product [Clonostachys byssicola]|uniref:Mid2 domain-containing protein n=1 Tax=Clonostachys byssicola TaxID=160290 RepID=A0A9N9XY76_9HYPO|nr:unnamed protein product [Clonostachys byssicola]
MKAMLPFLLSFFLLVQQCSTAATCVYPDGTDSKYDYPCDPNADVSICCGGRPGTSCLANKLCEIGTGDRSRGSCTKKNDPKCADYCLETRSQGISLISCTNSTKKENSYCCDFDPGCCDSNRVFDLLPASPTIYAVWDDSQTKFVSVGASSTATTTSLAPTNTNNTVGDSEHTGGLPMGAKAGIGVGAAVLALLIAAVAYLFWKIHRKPAAESMPPQTPQHIYPPTVYSAGISNNSSQANHIISHESESHSRPGFRQPSELDVGRVELSANSQNQHQS